MHEITLPAPASRRSVAPSTIPAVAEALEETAYDLAMLAGERLLDALGEATRIHYRDGGHGIMQPHDVVSEVEETIEDALRRRLAARHPGHAILGEARGRSGPALAEFTWLVDAVVGVTNFVNRVPCYAASVAVLRSGAPVAGAVWCSTTHLLRPGIYHAHRGGPVRFDGDALPAVVGVDRPLRRVSTAPAPVRPREAAWDHRHLDAPALEAALVSAGVLASARVGRAPAWAVAAGAVLVAASGQEVWTEAGGRWEPFVSFGETAEAWEQPMLFGDSLAVTLLRAGALAL